MPRELGPAAQEYLERTLRTWVGAAHDADADIAPLPDRLARRLLRVEEYERSHRDQWGCWEFGQCESFREGTLWVPELDRFAQEQRATLEGRARLEPLWPDGHAFAVCLTHDVDFVSEQLTPAQAARWVRAGLAGNGSSRSVVNAIRPPVRLARALANGIRRNPSAATALERCVELERSRGVTSSYFFTVFPERAASRFDPVYLPDDPCCFDGRNTTIAAVMRELVADGFDVGLHGSFNSATEPGMLLNEKKILEEALGKRVTTTRQHFLHWDVRKTPAFQAQAGLLADSSLGFNRSLGFRAGTSLPFRRFDLESGTESGLLQVPLSIHDTPLFRADGLKLDRQLAIEATLGIVREIESVGGLATLLIHPGSLVDERLLAVYEAVLDFATERGAWITSLRGVSEWWSERERRLGATSS